MKSPKAGTFLPGSQVTFTMIVNNPSDHVDTNVHLHDQLPGNGGLTWVSAAPSQGVCAIVANVLDCNLGSLAAHTAATVTVTSPDTTPIAACQGQPNPVALGYC